MKPVILSLFILITSNLSAQTYQYYFIEARATAKGEIAVIPENNIQYPDIDSLVCERSETKVKEKKYPTYSDMFNRLSKEGLEFVQVIWVPKIGGAAQFIAGSGTTAYLIWRRKM